MRLVLDRIHVTPADSHSCAIELFRNPNYFQISVWPDDVVISS